MFHVSPLAFAAVFAGASIFFSLQCSGYVYVTGAAGRYQPYNDIGFMLLPDLSSTASWLPATFACLHGGAAAAFFMLHEHRITILRRTLLLIGGSVYLYEAQALCTTLPNPNPTYMPSREWQYDLYVPQCVVVALMAGFYVAPLKWRCVWWGAAVVGCLMTIAVHVYYTVDVICSLIPPTLVFLLYHWYCRSEVAILKRNVVYWLERDVFDIDWSPHDAVATSGSTADAGGAADAVVAMSAARMAACANSWVVNEHRWIPKAWNVFQLEREGSLYSIYGPSCIFGVTDGRGPSDATLSAGLTVRGREEMTQRRGSAAEDEASSAVLRVIHELDDDPALRIVAELIQRAECLTPWERAWWPRLSAAACCAFGASVGLLNLVSIHIADGRRPLHVLLPPDILHDHVPELPDHTADFFIYPIVLMTLVFTIKSRFTWVIFHRIGLIYGGSMLLRMVTMVVTAIPDPSPSCAERSHPPEVTCGDLVYSGHTVGFLMCALTFRYFTREYIWGAVAWAATAAGLFCVVASRLHYTKDVVVCLFVVALVNHIARVALFKCVNIVQRSRVAWWIECGFYIAVAPLEAEQHPAPTDSIQTSSDVGHQELAAATPRANENSALGNERGSDTTVGAST